ncbi:hypothetical protein AAHA92_18234 [Salvia divinorum]|uniref:Uncharacterized protein n=1 Tax=Salvia divinorum TaxID=28513 RepID=A0ABD1H5G8_SALDI
MDKLVLETAIRLRSVHPWPGDNIPESVAFEAGSMIERELGVQITPLEVNQRLIIMQARYPTFKDVVATPSTCWVPTMQNVIAVDTVWKEIFKTHHFAAAYYHRDEPKFHKLCVLFGWYTVKTEGHQEETIVISDTIDEVSAPPTLAAPVVVDLDEVNSPLPQMSKVFTEDVDSLDRESINGLPNPYFALSPDGGLLQTICNSNSYPPTMEE